MASLTVEIPQSATVPAAQVVTFAARRAGYTAEHEGTAEDFLAAYLAEHVHQLYASARVDEVVAEVRESLPRPERPRVRESGAATEPGSPGTR